MRFFGFLQNDRDQSGQGAGPLPGVSQRGGKGAVNNDRLDSGRREDGGGAGPARWDRRARKRPQSEVCREWP